MNAAISRRKAKLVAACYALYAVYYLIAAGVLASAVGWREISRHALAFGWTAALLIVAVTVNTSLAIGSWRVVDSTPEKRKLLLGGAILIAAVFVLGNLVGFWNWYSSSPRPEFGTFNLFTTVAFVLGYVYCAFTLFRLTSYTTLAPQA
jgi:hypothetical protein